mgnify:CR=1 FL=1
MVTIIEKKVISIVSNALNINSINLQSSQNNTSEWDSFGYLSIICDLEKEFALVVTEENINNFGSIKNILNEINHL